MFSILLLSVAHVLPSGDVDRAMQVTVTPDEIRIDYRFGLGEKALDIELTRLAGDDDIPADPVDAARLHMELAAREIGSRLRVTVGERQLPVEFRESDLFYQHHFRAVCQFRIDISDLPGRSEVRIVDRNFAKYPGHGQIAAKPRGGFQFFDSDQALILLRADRFPISAGERFVPPEIVMYIERKSDDDESSSGSAQSQPNEGQPADGQAKDGQAKDGQAKDGQAKEEQAGDRRKGKIDEPDPTSRVDPRPSKSAETVSWTPWLIRAMMLAAMLIAGSLAFRK